MHVYSILLTSSGTLHHRRSCSPNDSTESIYEPTRAHPSPEKIASALYYPPLFNPAPPRRAHISRARARAPTATRVAGAGRPRARPLSLFPELITEKFERTRGCWCRGGGCRPVPGTAHVRRIARPRAPPVSRAGRLKKAGLRILGRPWRTTTRERYFRSLWRSRALETAIRQASSTHRPIRQSPGRPCPAGC